MEVDDEYFNYTVTAVVADTSVSITQYDVSLSSTSTVWEEIDFSGRVEACLKINFTLSLARDCRGLHTSAFLPICEYNHVMYICVDESQIDPQEFSSELLHVEVLFTAELNLQKIEITFTVCLNSYFCLHNF